MKIERNVMFWHADSDTFGDYASIFKNQQVPFRSKATSTHSCTALIQSLKYFFILRTLRPPVPTTTTIVKAAAAVAANQQF